MPPALSNDLRWRIIWLYYYKGMSIDEIEDLLFVSSRSIRRYLDLFNETGDVSLAEYQHGPHRLLDSLEEIRLIEILLARPDTYLDEIKVELHEATGVDVSVSTICRTIKHLGFSRKKLGYIALQRSEEKRIALLEEMAYIDADMLVWLDETGSDRRDAIRKYGYSLRGMTPVSYTLASRGKRLSAISAISTRGVEDVFVTDKTVNGDIFQQFIEQSLIPVLQPFNGTNTRSIVVMDNASVHHNFVEEHIHQTGAIVRFLPPYSPDLNPIEEVFSKVKQFLKHNQAAYTSTQSPSLILTMGFNAITAQDCIGYIRHSGYRV